MREAPDLDAMYGSVQPPRAKPGKASGIQAAERGKDDGMVKIHPVRIVLNPDLTPNLSPLLDAVRRELQDGAVFKWTVARNGTVMLAPYKLSEHTKTLLLDQSGTASDTELSAEQNELLDKMKLAFEKNELPVGLKLPLGHPTLVGGLKEPEARMGGEIHYGKLHKNDAEPSFYINNDSGRYSEYADRNEEMLKNVAKHFDEIGFPVKEKWMEKEKRELINKPINKPVARSHPEWMGRVAPGGGRIHLARKGHSEPGAKTVWEGLRDVRAFAHTIKTPRELEYGRVVYNEVP